MATMTEGGQGMIATELRENLIEEARDVARSTWPELPDERACLYEACSLSMVLAFRHGFSSMLQAGYAAWPIIEPEHDDGVCSTHFQFGGVPESLARALVGAGVNPFHVWLAHRDPDTIIDPSTRSWPAAARDAGLEWRAPVPPPFVWATEPEREKLGQTYRLGIVYRADIASCVAAHRLAVGGKVYSSLAKTLGVTKGGGR